MILENVTLASTGRYRCEVSAEAPSFQTVSDHGDMVVVGKTITFLVAFDVIHFFMLDEYEMKLNWVKVLY